MSSALTLERPVDAPREESSAAPKSMIERMTAIIDAFPDGASSLLLEEISQITDLPRSTAHRILKQLIEQGWMEHSDDGYRLGARCAGRARTGASTLGDLRAVAAPVLWDLAPLSHAVVHLSVLEESRIVYIDKVGGGRLGQQLPSQVGRDAPASATAAGKSMLSMLTEDQVRARFATPLPQLTPKSIATLPRLLLELRNIKARHGLAFEVGEAVEGFACVASPIRAGAGQLAAVSLCTRIGHHQLDRLAPLVDRAARRIESGLRRSAADRGADTLSWPWSGGDGQTLAGTSGAWA